MVRKESRLNFHKADFNKIREDLQAVDWNKELGEKPIEDMWKTFHCKLEKITVASTPRTTKGRHQRNKWMDRGTLTSVRKKHQLFRKWQQTKDDLDYTAYIRARNKAAKDCRQAKKRLEKTVAADCKKNPKVFWSYVKSKTTVRSGIGGMKNVDRTRTSSDQEKAETLNSFFQSVFTCEDKDQIHDPPSCTYDHALEDIEILEDSVTKLLKSLNTKKAAGPGGITPLLLVETADALTQAYNTNIPQILSIRTGDQPRCHQSIRKEAN